MLYLYQGGGAVSEDCCCAKQITLTKTSYTLKKGKSVTVKAATVLQYPKLQQLSDAHAKEFRYASSDKSIATVDKNGKIT